MKLGNETRASPRSRYTDAMRTRLSLAFALVQALAFSNAIGCGDNTNGDFVTSNTTDIADACNPLGGTSCMMPWPSSTYLKSDPTTSSGFRLDIPIEATPVNSDNLAIDPGPWNRLDGFSAAGAILAAFPGGVSAQGLPASDDPAASQAADSPILLIDMSTGERPLFFAEVDEGVDVDDSERVLFIRPLVRLKAKTRYAVAIRNTVRGPDGMALPRPPGFEAILAGSSFGHPRFAGVAKGYDAIFAAIAAHGVDREELVLAWDFVTASDESLTQDLLTMRDKALPVIGTNGSNLTFVANEVTGGDPALVERLFTGTYDTPNFLTDGESDRTQIIRGVEGLPQLDGTFAANFSAIIPECVNTEPLPRPTIIFGHGLFGSAKGYIENNFLQTVAQDKCFVIIAGDFIGLTERQISAVALSVNNLNRSISFSEMLGQSVINFIALEQLVRGPMAADERFAFNGNPVIDTSRIWYLGGSLGGIMGATFMAYDPTIELGALGVPGSNWSLLFERSVAWVPLQIAARAAYADPLEHQIMISMLAFSMERWDPITTAHRVLADPLPGTPGKQLLLYETINDSLVSNLTTEMLVRTMNLPIIGPSVRVPFGFSETTSPVSSGFSVYDENVPVSTTNNVPPSDDNGTHSGVNGRQAVLDQVEHFFFEREVVNTCGPAGDPVACDCSTGACD